MLAGCDTVVTSSPIQALAVLQGGATFDAIVCDVMMPELSGTELYMRCFLQSPELGRRFVFASADPISARKMIAQAASRVGATHTPILLIKPTSRTLLMSAVTNTAASASRESGTYVMQFPSTLWTEQGEAKGLSVATEATEATGPTQATEGAGSKRGSGGFR
jgi:CheY-like chemotaxis protein